MNDRSDVIVAGAGPVGLITALKLARAGARVVVVDKLASVSTAPRAVAYLWPSPLVLDGIGVLDEAIDAGVVKSGLEFRWPATGAIGKVSLSCLEVKDGEKSPFDLGLGQDVLANIVVKHLKQHDNVQLCWNTKVTGVTQDDGEVCVALETPDGPEQIRGAWLVGADGSYSTVRESLGVPFAGYTWPDRFVAANIHYDFAAHGYGPSTYVSDPVDWAFIIQIDKSGLWRLAYGEDASLPPDGVRDRMSAHCQAILPDPGQPFELESISSYRIHERCASTFRVGRVLLAGDAAHICNPSGGYGLLGGIYDANALAISLIAVLEGKRDETVLDDYAHERRTIFLEKTSPRAAQFKSGMMDPEGIKQLHASVGQAAADPAAMRAFVSLSQDLAGTFPVGPNAKLS
jgi:2-polyprenyl-6-methoxyphenol hydroxylase-like FAD-dependent oxidoreductase